MWSWLFIIAIIIYTFFMTVGLNWVSLRYGNYLRFNIPPGKYERPPEITEEKFGLFELAQHFSLKGVKDIYIIVFTAIIGIWYVTPIGHLTVTKNILQITTNDLLSQLVAVWILFWSLILIGLSVIFWKKSLQEFKRLSKEVLQMPMEFETIISYNKNLHSVKDT